MSYPKSRNYSARRRNSGRNNRGRSGGRGLVKQYIHHSKFVQSAKSTDTAVYQPTHTFADFNIHDKLKANLEHLGFSTPTPIQDQSILPALEGKDIVGIASTGTGKTAAFALPILNRLINDRLSKVLVLAPTRELAQQIEAEFRALGAGSNLTSAVLIGGSNMREQLRSLRSNPQIVIGTPGRTKDHLQRRSLRLQHFNIVVLDEVDRMLDMGFIKDITTLLGVVSQKRQSFFFSATIDPKVSAVINRFSKEPVQITVSNGITSDSVDQNVVMFSHSSEKISKLHDLLISGPVSKALVFDDTKRSVEQLSKELQVRGFDSDVIHGGKSQSQREKALRRFKDNQLQVLVATDVAARGIDVADISHVINYSQPKTFDDYIHRIGRAGRAGKLGHAVTFVEKPALSRYSR